MSERIKGRVKWFDPKKGYGFIDIKTIDPKVAEANGLEKDVFIHMNYLPKEVSKLDEGDAISFSLEQTRKGPRAVALKINEG